MSDVDVVDEVDEDERDGACITLTIGLESDEGHEDERDDHGYPLHWFQWSWLNPQQLLAIATDLAAADERGEDIRDVLEAWRRAYLDGDLDE